MKLDVRGPCTKAVRICWGNTAAGVEKDWTPSQVRLDTSKRSMYQSIGICQGDITGGVEKDLMSISDEVDVKGPCTKSVGMCWGNIAGRVQKDWKSLSGNFWRSMHQIN